MKQSLAWHLGPDTKPAPLQHGAADIRADGERLGYNSAGRGKLKISAPAQALAIVDANHTAAARAQV